jgi:esterase FrsA
MSYIYPIEPADMFEDRMAQILSFGIPEDDVKALKADISDMWADAPGGWVYEWSKVADRYATNGRAYLSAMAYGWATPIGFILLKQLTKRNQLLRRGPESRDWRR